MRAGKTIEQAGATVRTERRVVRAEDAWIATDTVGVSFAQPPGSIRWGDRKAGLWVDLEFA
jgi:hypothetical protein